MSTASREYPSVIRPTEAIELNDKLALAGYSSLHAPTHSEGWHVSTVAMRVRTFDRRDITDIFRSDDAMRAFGVDRGESS